MFSVAKQVANKSKIEDAVKASLELNKERETVQEEIAALEAKIAQLKTNDDDLIASGRFRSKTTIKRLTNDLEEINGS